ncbi:MAG: GumC family protein [Bryobacteraceae bacterium]
MTASQGYVSISRRSLDVEDYIDVLRRHVSWIIGPLFAGLVISCVIAFVLPNVYISQAMMQITPAQIPQTLVPTTLSQQMTERINQMQQEILSRNSVSDLINKYNLYARDLKSKPLEDVLEQMQHRDIHINMLNIAGQGNRPASAFSITFRYPDKYKAQTVVAALVSKFSESNENLQRNQAGVTNLFFKDELAAAKTELDRLEGEITKFKMENAGRLPQQMTVNAQALNSLQTQLAAVNEALNRNAQDKMMLESRLQTMQGQMETIRNMAPAMDEANRPPKDERLAQLDKEVTAAEAQLAGYQELYTDNHPDIRNLKALLEVKRKERDGLRKQEEAAEAKNKPRKIMNPQVAKSLSDVEANIEYTKAQLRAIDIDRKERLKQQDQINRNMGGYQARIEASPINEQKYDALVREHLAASQHYQEVQQKQNVASAGEDLTKRKAGENLEVLDPASLPDAPADPNRWLIVGIGTGLGLTLGVCFAAAREVKDTSLKNLKDVRAYTNLPVLSSIPLLENALLVRRKRRLAFMGWSMAVIVGVIAISASMYYHFFYLKA